MGIHFSFIFVIADKNHHDPGCRQKNALHEKAVRSVKFFAKGEGGFYEAEERFLFGPLGREVITLIDLHAGIIDGYFATGADDDDAGNALDLKLLTQSLASLAAWLDAVKFIHLLFLDVAEHV